MKQLFVLVLASILIIGCCDCNKNEPKISSVVKYLGEQIGDGGAMTVKQIREFEYKNHQYIIFQTTGTQYTTSTIHNPDCLTCKKRKSL